MQTQKGHLHVFQHAYTAEMDIEREREHQGVIERMRARRNLYICMCNLRCGATDVWRETIKVGWDTENDRKQYINEQCISTSGRILDGGAYVCVYTRMYVRTYEKAIERIENIVIEII